MESKLEVSNLINPFIKSIKAFNAELDNLFELGLSDYLFNQTMKYYFINTFLFRGEKVRFKDVYFPVSVRYNKLTTKFDEAKKTFEDYKSILLIGSAGSGKSTLLRHIFLDFIKNKEKIPVLIELRSLNEYDGKLEDVIKEKVLSTKAKPSEYTFKRALDKGAFLFLFDGYDEIFSSKKEKIKLQIEEFVDANPENWFLITTRPGSGIESFSRFHNFQVMSLSELEVQEFVEKNVENSERKTRIITTIQDPKNKSYRDYLGNPLLLSMFILAFENHPEIPRRKSAFYRNVFDTLYSKHDGITKNSFPREKLSKLEQNDFERILSAFSFLTIISGKYAFTEELLSSQLNKVKKATNINSDVKKIIYDLQTSISILILDGFEYHFPHRSMQEYFTALFISNLPSEKKGQAYQNLSVRLKSSTDSGSNLWQLLEELDSSSFKLHFLLPSLRSMNKHLEKKNGRNLITAFLKLFNATIVSFFSEGDVHKTVEIYFTSGLNFSVSSYCEILNYRAVFDFPKNSGCYQLLYSHKSIHEHAIDYKKKAVLDILYKFKLHEIALKFRIANTSKIKQYEKEIKNEILNIDNLLGI
jgi:energy-coupling factor transporter ATP-binding protein EcfA2